MKFISILALVLTIFITGCNKPTAQEPVPPASIRYAYEDEVKFLLAAMDNSIHEVSQKGNLTDVDVSFLRGKLTELQTILPSSGMQTPVGFDSLNSPDHKFSLGSEHMYVRLVNISGWVICSKYEYLGDWYFSMASYNQTIKPRGGVYVSNAPTFDYKSNTAQYSKDLGFTVLNAQSSFSQLTINGCSARVVIDARVFSNENLQVLSEWSREIEEIKVSLSGFVDKPATYPKRFVLVNAQEKLKSAFAKLP